MLQAPPAQQGAPPERSAADAQELMKQIVARMPTDKADVFAYPIAWAAYDGVPQCCLTTACRLRCMRPWPRVHDCVCCSTRSDRRHRNLSCRLRCSAGCQSAFAAAVPCRAARLFYIVCNMRRRHWAGGEEEDEPVGHEDHQGAARRGGADPGAGRLRCFFSRGPAAKRLQTCIPVIWPCRHRGRQCATA